MKRMRYIFLLALLPLVSCSGVEPKSKDSDQETPELQVEEWDEQQGGEYIVE